MTAKAGNIAAKTIDARGPMLKIEGLSHVYAGGVQALSNVNLEILQGMFGLLGPNGAGKSTLMRCVATLLAPTCGRIAFDGIDAAREPEKIRRLLGYLPQDFGVYPRVSAGAMLDHLAVLKGITGRGERRDAVEAMLVKTNLWAVRKKALSGFSGGMRQRFGIAQALIGSPQLLIVDEPTAGLDPEERNRFLNLLSEIGEQVVVILSTHIVEDVSDLCQRMAIIAEGRIVACGEPAALTEALDGRIWKKIIAKEALQEVRTRHTVLDSRLSGGRIAIHVLADANPGDGFVCIPPGLEDVYFSTLHAPHAA
jgi:ABC-2 type transport system ATP-binding protein